MKSFQIFKTYLKLKSLHGHVGALYYKTQPRQMVKYQ